MSCKKCRHWFVNPNIVIPGEPTEGKCLVSEIKAQSNQVCNAWELSRIAELEGERRWIPVSERLPEEEGWYYAGVLGRFGDHYTHDVYFYAEDAAFRWKDCEGDKVYCWLGGVPALPQPPEVQE